MKKLISKKFISKLLLTLVIPCLLAGCADSAQTASSDNAQSSAQSSDSSDSTDTSDDYVLKIAYNNSLGEAPIQRGVEKNFFEEEGLKFEMVKIDAAHMPEAIGSGQVEAGFGLLGKYLQPIDNGLDIKITAGIHTGCTKVLVPNDSDIKTVADLKGKKVGTTGLGAAAPTIITKRSLYHAGLNPSDENGDVEFAVFSGSDLAQALQNGAVDAIANSDPAASIAERDLNLRPIIDTATDDEYKNEYCCISFVTGDLVKDHPDIAKKFTTAIMKSSKWVSENIEETAKIQVEKEWVSGDPEFNAKVLSTYNYKPSVNGGLEALKTSVPDLKAIGLISDNKTEDEFINDVFVDIGVDESAIFGEEKADKESSDKENSEETSKDSKEASVPDCCEHKEAEAATDCCEGNDMKELSDSEKAAALPDCCA
ncbi:MAG: ABC transporter substrate-binding protein [Firmicutes bacterium]|nr:ABC transporter substrate-binding protein [Bacillota bacterium]